MLRLWPKSRPLPREASARSHPRADTPRRLADLAFSLGGDLVPELLGAGLTAAGRELADAAASDLEDAVAGRMAAIDPALRVLGTATLADLTLPTSA